MGPAPRAALGLLLLGVLALPNHSRGGKKFFVQLATSLSNLGRKPLLCSVVASISFVEANFLPLLCIMNIPRGFSASMSICLCFHYCVQFYRRLRKKEFNHGNRCHCARLATIEKPDFFMILAVGLMYFLPLKVENLKRNLKLGHF
jgi:hypothetical protein